LSKNTPLLHLPQAANLRLHWTLAQTRKTPESGGPLPLPTATGDWTADALNRSFNLYPAVTGMLWLWHSPLSTLGYMSAFYLLHIPLAPELAPAFVLHSLVRRMRLPLTMASAALLARARPALCTVPVTRLLLAPLLAVQALRSPPTPAPPGTLLARLRSSASALWSGLNRLDELVGGTSTLNRYGLAFIFAGRATSTFSLVGITLALKYGVDVEAALMGVGARLDEVGLGKVAWVFSLLPEEHSSGAGGELRARAAALAVKDATMHWAAAALGVNLTYPLVLRYGVAGVAEAVGRTLGESARWNIIVEAVKEGQRVAQAQAQREEEAERAAMAAAARQQQQGGEGSTCEQAAPRGVVFRLALFDTPQDKPKHWISRFYVVKDHCC
jgi:hypothetical protein